MRVVRYAFVLSLCVACGFRTIGRLEHSPDESSGGGGVSGGGAGGATSAGSAGVSSAVGGAGAQGGAAGAANAGAQGSLAGTGEGGEAGAIVGVPEPRALILIDSRLYDRLSEKIEHYRTLAEARRGFPIRIRVEAGLDDRDFRSVKALLASEVANHQQLQGVLFVGNVSVPAYYKVRADNLHTRLSSYFYEDLDATWLRAQDPGTLDPECIDFTVEQNCNTVGNQLVPPHDFDRIQPGDQLGPELWSAYWPVGVTGSANDYATFAAQLSPYLDKLIAFYTGPSSAFPKTNGHYYFVANDPGWATFELVWSSAPRAQIDLYGKVGPNGETGPGCYVNGENRCYTRWPLESYASFNAFKQAYQALPPLGESWQDFTLFRAHMQAALYDFVEITTPGYYDACLVGTQEAKSLQQGGLVVALNCSSATGFALPRPDNHVDLPALPSDNVGVTLLYGPSHTLAVLGDPATRGHSSNAPVVFATLKTEPESYLGVAHLARMRRNYAEAGYESCKTQGGTNCGYSLSENVSEMLLGDPFLDLR